MNVRKWVATVALALSCGTGYGQVGIRLGMTDSEVDRALGAPTRFYDAGLQSFTQGPPVVFKGPIWECHRRVTKIQEYEVRVRYANDPSASRLHPTLRVFGLVVIFDKPLKFKESLADSPEIRALCADKCSLQIVQPKGSAGGEEGTYIRIADNAKTAALILEFFDENRNQKRVMLPDDPISEIEMEAYFSLEKYSNILSVADSGFISSAQWPAN